MMVKVEASVVVKAPRPEVYAWFAKPENWAEYAGAAWKSIKVIKRGALITATQEGTLARRSMKGTFKYTCSPPEKIEVMWSGSYGRVAIKGQHLTWVFKEMSGETEVCWSTDATIPCYVELLGPDGRTKLQSLMQGELEKIRKTFQK